MAPTLGYWSLRGRAQPIRYLLHYARVKYNEKLYDIGHPPVCDRSQWLNVKETLDIKFPNLPYYLDGEYKFSESSAIIRYLARKYDLDGKTEQEKIDIDVSCGVMNDMSIKLFLVVYSQSELEKFVLTLDDHVKKLSKLVDSGKCIAGDKITYADFILYELLQRFKLLDSTIFNREKSLLVFQKTVEELPGIKEYLASPEFQKISRKFHGPMAILGAGTQ